MRNLMLYAVVLFLLGEYSLTKMHRAEGLLLISELMLST